jgi:aldose 1-epimerase
MRSSALRHGDQEIWLRRGGVHLGLEPRYGGAVREFRVHGRPIFRCTPPGSGGDPFARACFPLVPYANRIAGGSFSFRGRTIELPRNWALDSNPIHGHGWRGVWDVIGQTGDSATLSFMHESREWPWPYVAEQRFALHDLGLAVELSIENIGSSPMPAMLGLHPYFPESPTARVAANVPRIWSTDARKLPILECLTPPGWGFTPARSIADRPLDHCFVGWDGEATLYWPNRTVTIRASDCRNLHVYAPQEHDYFCLEPMTDAVGALNRNADEVLTLGPRERHTIRVTFAVDTL